MTAACSPSGSAAARAARPTRSSRSCAGAGRAGGATREPPRCSPSRTSERARPRARPPRARRSPLVFLPQGALRRRGTADAVRVPQRLEARFGVASVAEAAALAGAGPGAGCSCPASRPRAPPARSRAGPETAMTVHFIGAGPGAPDLITVRGRDLLARCPVCLYAGSLVPRGAAGALPAGRPHRRHRAARRSTRSWRSSRRACGGRRTWRGCIRAICRSGAPGRADPPARAARHPLHGDARRALLRRRRCRARRELTCRRWRRSWC